MTRGGYNPNASNAKADVPGDRRSVTVTFNYGGEFRTLVAQTRKDAFAEASRRWGWGWDGEPVVSSPTSVYRDLIGDTKRNHGQDFHLDVRKAGDRDRYRRTGASYGDARR